MTGKISRCEDHGSIVAVIVECGDEQRAVPMDARSFRHMVEGRGADNVIGQEVEVRGEGAAASLVFLDESD